MSSFLGRGGDFRRLFIASLLVVLLFTVVELYNDFSVVLGRMSYLSDFQPEGDGRDFLFSQELIINEFTSSMRGIPTNGREDAAINKISNNNHADDNATILYHGEGGSTPLHSASNSAFSTSVSSEKPRVITRWTGKQLKDLLYGRLGVLDNWNTSLVDWMPKPYGNDAIIYNRKAWEKLRRLFQVSSKVILCSLGGSVTAGGNLHTIEPRNDRWDSVFANMIHHSFHTTHVQVENRGHGSQATLHSARLMQSFVTLDTDLIAWEFAINDSVVKDCQRMINSLILFLNQVQEVAKSDGQSPPLVILVYLWDVSSFDLSRSWHQQKNGTVPDSVFQCHQDIAASYDFVVGSVNVASYMDHLEWNDIAAYKEKLMAPDPNHPNHRGHWLMGYLLWDLVTDEDRREHKGIKTKDTLSNSTMERPLSLYSPCPEIGKSNISSPIGLMLHQPTKASWTAELPQNPNLRPGMLEPIAVQSNETIGTASFHKDRNLTLLNHAKQHPKRDDRKFSVLLPCCSTGERLSFDLSWAERKQHKANTALESNGMWISGLQVTPLGRIVRILTLLKDFRVDFWNGTKLVRVITSDDKTNIGAGNPPTREEDIVRGEWTKFDGRVCKLDTMPWLALPEPLWASRIDFCNQKASCWEDADIKGGHSLMHLILY